MARISFIIFLLRGFTWATCTNPPEDIPDLNVSTISPELSTPPVLNPTNFFAYLEEDKTRELYAELVSGLDNYTIQLEHKFTGDLDEEFTKQKANWEEEMLPYRLCCEPQYVRYHINQAKVKSDVKWSKMLFFQEAHRKEWIEKILQSKNEDNFAGRLYQTLASNNIDVEDFVNETRIIEMRASVAIHTYLSRTVRPLTAMMKLERLRKDRFRLSVVHEKYFNVLADAMNITKISLGEYEEVQIIVCEEIVDLRINKTTTFEE